MTGSIEDVTLSTGTSIALNSVSGSSGLTVDGFMLNNGLPRSKDITTISNSTTTSLSSGAYTTMPFDTVEVDTGGMASVANDRIVIQKTGTHYINYGVGMRMQNSSVSHFICLYANGSTALQCACDSLGGTDERTNGVHLIRTFTAGDFVQALVFQQTSATNTIAGDASDSDLRSRMTAVYIGD